MHPYNVTLLKAICYATDLHFIAQLNLLEQLQLLMNFVSYRIRQQRNCHCRIFTATSNHLRLVTNWVKLWIQSSKTFLFI